MTLKKVKERGKKKIKCFPTSYPFNFPKLLQINRINKTM